MKLLSIIIPFHNSAQKCKRLLETLKNCRDPAVEVICIDDGSQDNTLQLIYDLKSRAAFSVKVISQENKGPGGARNAGLDVSNGKYLWLVDSDDDIRLETALRVLRENMDQDPDFIDFNISSGGQVFSSMPPEPKPPKRGASYFGRIVSKIFNNRVFNGALIRYPEYCIYEDNLLGFVIPLYVTNYIKSDECAYLHQEDYESVTRGRRSDRYFDRMTTAYWGYVSGCNLSRNLEVREWMKKRFVLLYLINTVSIPSLPNHAWLEKLRVMRKFRTDVKRLGIEISLRDIIDLMPRSSTKYKAVFAVLYKISICLPEQENYFQKKRMNAWVHPFFFMPPHNLPNSY